ncbi:MAG: hypothetical protein M0Q00_01530 [Acholeplasmataceae bacterium]|nr:hypothetical protein [Acholeplasmataceae bacterium]
MKLLVTIVERGKGEEVTTLISQFKVDYSVVFLGQGTASSKMLEYLSLENTKKDIVLSLIDDADEKDVLNRLNKHFKLDQRHHGIAYTVGLTSINRLAFKYLMGKEVFEDGR